MVARTSDLCRWVEFVWGPMFVYLVVVSGPRSDASAFVLHTAHSVGFEVQLTTCTDCVSEAPALPHAVVRTQALPRPRFRESWDCGSSRCL